MTRSFTGRHMAMILIAFFGVVIAVNFYMERMAVGTFGGTVVDNSYVASQRFNGWLAQARAQKALGWQTEVRIDARRRETLTLSAGGSALPDASVTAIARHPLGRESDIALRFATIGPGKFRAVTPLPTGRWLVHLVVRQADNEVRLIETLQ